MLEWLNPLYIQLHLSPSSYASSEEHKEEAVQEDSEKEGNLIWFSSSILLLLLFFSLDFSNDSTEKNLLLKEKRSELMLKATICI